MLLSFGSLLIFDIGVSIALFTLARSRGASESAAYLLAAIGPLLGMASEWIRQRKLGGASVIILIVTLVSAAAALIPAADPRLLLAKDAVVTGGLGLVAAVTLLPIVPKPLMFFFGVKFGTDGSREGVQRWYDLFDRYPTFRRSQYLITAVWAVAFCLEAALKLVLAYTVAFDTAFTVNQIAPFVVLAVTLTWTIWYGQRQRRAGERRQAAQAAQATQAEATTA